MSTQEQTGPVDFAAAGFVLNSGNGAGVASLDTPLVNQTKSEIRTLASEIAELAHAKISPDEFFDGFLPRLTTAMGALAAGVWSVDDEVSADAKPIRLLANHSLPSELYSGDIPTQLHESVLECVIAESQPILVPPSTVKLDAERPVNPLSESLVIVPVLIEDRVELVLEVVQRASGGPAAQRGYLRFVAQMADLLADYFRRHKLRGLDEKLHRLQSTERSLFQLACEPDSKKRFRIAAAALAEIFQADQAIILQRSPTIRRNYTPRAISGVHNPDPRSEVTQVAIRLCRLSALPAASASGSVGDCAARWLEASERRADERQQAGTRQIESETESGSRQSQRGVLVEGASEEQIAIDRLCDLLRCRRLLRIQLDPAANLIAFLAYAHGASVVFDESPGWKERLNGTATAVGGLLVASHRKRLAFGQSSKQGSIHPLTRFLWRGAVRVALVAAAGVLAAIPVPQQISATARLQPVHKNVYYAPLDAVVAEVLVDEGDQVAREQTLLLLTSPQLQNEIDTLRGEWQLTKDRMEEVRSQLNRDKDLGPRDVDRLEFELKQLVASREAFEKQLLIMRQRQSDLDIKARAAGQVSTWSLRNHLLQRPVATGQMLVSTFEPEGPWKLILAVPDHRLGLVAAAMKDNAAGPDVRFSLASHPDCLLNARLQTLASQATQIPGDANPAARVVFAEATMDAGQLPLKKDGAIANATIDCGRVPLVWLAVRDVYWAISSRLKLFW